MSRVHQFSAPQRRVKSTGPISNNALINTLHRHVVELITALYLLYVLLGTLIPFDFSMMEGLRAGRFLFGLGNARSGLPDLMSNIGLYVPLGVLLYASATRVFGRPWLSVAIAVGSAAVLSLTVESIQLLSPTRISSVVDFAANVFGATSGVVLSCLCRGPARRFRDTLWQEIRQDRFAACVRLYAALLCVGAVVPFTPTFDVKRLAESARASTWVPFAQSRALAAEAQAAELVGDHSAAAAGQRDRMFLWARWAAELLSFVVFGWLLHRLMRTHYGFKPHWCLALTAYITAALALVMSAAQVVILSRGFHVTDLLFRAVGAACGYGLYSLCLARGGVEGASVPHLGPRLIRPTLVIALLFVLFTGLAPFSFNYTLYGVAEKVGSDGFLPFYSYYVGRFDRVCADLWSKSLLFGFLGAALWMCRTGGSNTSWRAQPLRIAGIAVLVSGFIEICQLFLRSRVPSLTDPIVAAVAAWVAVVCVQYAEDFYRHAVRSEAGQRSAAAPGRSLSPTDALIATLIPDHPPGPGQTPPSEEPAEHT